MSRSLVLAIDVGTSAIKAAVVDAQGNLRSEGQATQKFLAGAPGQREHDPHQTWRATKRAITSALGRAPSGWGNELAAVAATGPRGTFCLTGHGGVPLSNFITWQDQRAASIIGTLSACFDASRYQALTGMSFDGYSALSKLTWMHRQDPALFDGVVTAMTPQSHVLWRLGAEISVVDPSVAAYFGLLDLHTRLWRDDLREAFGLGLVGLPQIVDAGSVVGMSSLKTMRELGIPAGVPLVVAASDGICAELGLGVTKPGQIYSYLGTASAIAGPIPAQAASPPGSSGGIIRMPGRDPDHDRLLGLGGAGGSAVRWAMGLLRVRNFERFDALAASCAPGAGGVLFLPTMAGAAAPEPEPTARGAIAGLSLASGPDHVARAIFEGVALELRWMLDGLHRSGLEPTEVRLTGGGARSRAWIQVVADVLQLPTLTRSDTEAGLKGAASYAFAAVSEQPADVLSAQWAAGQHVTEPSTPLGDLYGTLAENYKLIRKSFAGNGVDRELFETAARLSNTADA